MSNLIQLSPAATGKKYWRSLGELYNKPEFKEWVEKEFPGGAEMLDSGSRRNVLKLMAASFGLAGLTACRRPIEKILPASKGIEDYNPGQAYFYSSAFTLSGVSQGILVEVNDGRPTKIEGNPDHPYSQGAASGLAQASILNLYDPDRSKEVLEGGKSSTWDKFGAAWKAKAPSLGGGDKLRILSLTVGSPTLDSTRKALLAKYPKAKWTEYEPVNQDQAKAGASLAFGPGIEVHPQYDKAKVILSLDCDFLGEDTPTTLAIRQFSDGRRVKETVEDMNRLYAVEAHFSLTGAMADHRKRMKVSEVRAFAEELANALGALPGLNVTGQGSKFLTALVKDLKAHSGSSLVVAGTRQPAVVHGLAAAINQALGNVGTTVLLTKSGDTPIDQVAALKTLTGELNAGAVDTLVILGGNPAYTAPTDLRFPDAIKKAATSIHLGFDINETAKISGWHLPEAYYLETWGDGRAPDGTVTIQQPMIEPLYGGKSALELTAMMAGLTPPAATPPPAPPTMPPPAVAPATAPATAPPIAEAPPTVSVAASITPKGYDLVRNYWKSSFVTTKSANPENTWRESLHSGVVANTRYPEAKASADSKRIAGALATEPKATGSGFEVSFYPSASMYDGAFTNNGWLMECPDPMTKIIWGNAAMVSPKTAKDKALTDNDEIKITANGQSLNAAIRIQPGLADNAIVITLGYGRTAAGRIGQDIGYNAYALRTTTGFWFVEGATIEKTGATQIVGSTQEHNRMEEPMLVSFQQPNRRPLAREATIDEYKKNPKIIEEMQEVPELASIYGDWKYDKGDQWAMAIDLNACIGCNACILACQSENNIPIVGKKEVIRGREMHWIRLDRYYTGSDEDPQAITQPVTCMQCENAPCENVCPVAATTHSPEGLNDMAYNRCVGTRYCANNCPYKVRKFNYLNWHRNMTEVEMLASNPQVTVRMRGVMEKCTYCTQRIAETRIRVRSESRAAGLAPRAIKDGEIVTACQQTCPANAIAFGNQLDPTSRVAQLKKQERNYAMLAELNVRPRTTYQARLRNPNPELVNG
jgi:MoCo/4Fe-4S cofactor protein with predicted Tat translocation signal